MTTCVLCGDTGYRGTDAYGERVRCVCTGPLRLDEPVITGANDMNNAAETCCNCTARPGELHARHCPTAAAANARDRQALKAAWEAAAGSGRGAILTPEPIQITPPVSRLELKPGDRLVLTTDGELTALRREALVGQVRSWLGRNDVKVLVLEGGARLTVLGREDTAGERGE